MLIFVAYEGPMLRKAMLVNSSTSVLVIAKVNVIINFTTMEEYGLMKFPQDTGATNFCAVCEL